MGSQRILYERSNDRALVKSAWRVSTHFSAYEKADL